MDIELKELSNIYLQTLKEQENGAAGEGQNPQQSADVGAHAKAIRYQARRDNVPLPKAFNDYVSKNQLSGTERTALRQKLGFMGEETIVEKKGCNHTKKGEECPEHGIKDCPMDEEEHKIGGGNLKKLASKANKRVDADVDGDVDTKDMKSGETGEFVPGPDGKKIKSKFRAEHVSWRTELSEYTDATPKSKTDEKSSEKITEKKVKNKIVINPPQGMTEAIEELGGQILEMVEIEEAENADAKKAESMRKKQMASREQMMKKQHMLDKQRMQAQKQLKIPSGHMGEDADLDKMQKDADDNRARAAKLKDRNVTRGSAALAARAVERDVKKAAKTGPQQYPKPGKGVKKIEKPKPTHTKTGAMRVEETEDSLRDKRQERGGVDGNVNYKRKPQFSANPAKKKAYDGMSALDRVKADIRGKYGKGAIIDTKKKG